LVTQWVTNCRSIQELCHRAEGSRERIQISLYRLVYCFFAAGLINPKDRLIHLIELLAGIRVERIDTAFERCQFTRQILTNARTT